MYRIEDLKAKLDVAETMVSCPVAGCRERVARQRRVFRTLPAFLCPEHRIYISPTTFEYADARRNFPLIDQPDWRLLRDEIASEKRESHRLGRERSEDAVTYNAFRTIERSGGLPDLLGFLTRRRQPSAELAYWSYSVPDKGTVPSLDAARRAFHEVPARGSEPDLIAITPTDLVFIEVKVTSSNATVPSRPEALSHYETAEDGWYHRMFKVDPDTVARIHRKYELMRFWLLGSWMAEQACKRFTLVSLTRDGQDAALETEFASVIRQTDDCTFAHWSWEAIADWASGEPATVAVSEYLRSKSIGYNASGILQRMLL